MPDLTSYDYAVIRVVPDLERGEFLNAGVILFAKTARALLSRTWLDEERLRRLHPGADATLLRAHLASFERIAEGGPGAGAIGELSLSGRFHWLVSPRSTSIQVSAVHSGLCADPAAELDRLFGRLVGRPSTYPFISERRPSARSRNERK